jgi:signal transduction histidine kinase
MQIRKKLTLQFILIVASIFILSLSSVYYVSSQYRKIQFRERLIDRAERTIRLLFEIDQVGYNVLKIIDKNNPLALNSENIAVYDSKYQLVYCNRNKLDLNITPELFGRVRNEKNIRFIQNKFEIIGIELQSENQKYLVFAGAIDVAGKKNLRILRNIIIEVFLLGLFIVLLSGWVYAGRTLAPISKMTAHAEKISISNINLRLDIGKSQDELSELAITFNNMLQRLENAIIFQKKFVANASHELRTPLTALMGQIEVSLMKERDALYYKNKLVSVLEDIKSLILTSNQLLALTQINADEFQIKYIPTRLDELILQTKTEFINRNPDYSVAINFNSLPENETELMIDCNEILLKTAFRNLLENGCKFSENNRVFWNIEFENQQVKLEFIDDGVGIAQEDMKNIFQPFNRGSNVKIYKGSGLGLSIVEKIVQLHQGSITVKSALNHGSTFTLYLPLHPVMKSPGAIF